MTASTWESLPVEVRKYLVSEDGKFAFYKDQGLDLILNEK